MRVNIEIMRVFVRLHRILASNAEAVFQTIRELVTPVFPVARGSCLPRAPFKPDVRVDASGSPEE